jgi:glyoxylase-like metal-dependent hydrolase (beta-lactamase superfamily II)
VIEVGDLRFEVIETPGHSQGGLCFYEKTEGVLFSGDTLFAGAIGRTDQLGGDYDLLMKSIFEKLMVLDGSVTVIPGHGPETSIATERMTNPFLMPFNEPYED